MRIDEYKVVRAAFENAFGFMLNRIEDGLGVDLHRERKGSEVEGVEERCWDEFMIALDALGVTFTECNANEDRVEDAQFRLAGNDDD